MYGCHLVLREEEEHEKERVWCLKGAEAARIDNLGAGEAMPFPIAATLLLAYHFHPRTPRAAPVRCCASEEVKTEVLPQEYFQNIRYDSADAVPWDLFGRPQPPVVAAEKTGAFGAAGTSILDCGCGAGDNAKFLAARGYDVLGFDLSPNAVATAVNRTSASPESAAAIAAAGGAVEFVTASACELAIAERVQVRARELGGFAAALDSALLHCLDDHAQRLYIDGLRPLLRPGGRLFVGCFSDANPDPWENPRRLSEAQLRALFSVGRGWRVLELSEAWYARPAARSASAGGAWTMAWWLTVERRAARFPSAETTPAEMLTAMLDALRAGDLPHIFRLLSRAKRLQIEEVARRDAREPTPPAERVNAALATMLTLDCPSLVGHESAEVVGSIYLDPASGLLPRWSFRVRVDGSRTYVFTLTRQSAFDGGDPRDDDGFASCWFVWSIQADDGGGGSAPLEARDPVVA